MWRGGCSTPFAKGIDPDDLIDVVREVQVGTIYNFSQLIDWSTENFDLDEAPDMQISVHFPNTNGTAAPIHELHSSLMEHDPAGRYGEGRSLEMRQVQKLQATERQALEGLIRSGNMSGAALLWKKYTGSELKVSLDAVQSLRLQIGY